MLADRCPPWLGEFADRHLRADFTGWTLARMLVRLGVIPPPTVAEYTTGMPAGLKMADQDDHGGMTGPEPEAALLADPSLLEDEVWRLFTVADAGFALEREDRRPSWWDGEAAQSQTWAQALTRLNAARKLDRNRLLDACLGAFSRDFNPNRVSWYATLLGQLQPTVDEIATRSATYLGLLAAGSKPALCVGQDGIGRLLAAGRLDAAELLAASTPALLHRQKSFAIAQLKLIEQAAARQPGCTPDAAAVVAAAFGHERQDIQEAALKLISKLGVPGGMPFETIRQHAADLSPSLAAEATALGLLGPPAAAAPAAAAPDDGLPATAGLESARAGGDPGRAGDRGKDHDPARRDGPVADRGAGAGQVGRGARPGAGPAGAGRSAARPGDRPRRAGAAAGDADGGRQRRDRRRARAGRRSPAQPPPARTARADRGAAGQARGADCAPALSPLLRRPDHLRPGQPDARLGRRGGARRRRSRGRLAHAGRLRGRRHRPGADDGGHLLGSGLGGRRADRDRPRRRAARRAGDRARRDHRRDPAGPGQDAGRCGRPAGRARPGRGAVAAGAGAGRRALARAGPADRAGRRDLPRRGPGHPAARQLRGGDRAASRKAAARIPRLARPRPGPDRRSRARCAGELVLAAADRAVRPHDRPRGAVRADPVPPPPLRRGGGRLAADLPVAAGGGRRAPAPAAVGRADRRADASDNRDRLHPPSGPSARTGRSPGAITGSRPSPAIPGSRRRSSGPRRARTAASTRTWPPAPSSAASRAGR